MAAAGDQSPVSPPPQQDDPPPNTFTNELEQWVCREFMSSIVFVEFRPKDPKKVKQVWDKHFPISGQSAEAKRQHAKRKEESKHNLSATGFVVGETVEFLMILTCAHVVDLTFNAKWKTSPAEIEALFEPWILCDHCEKNYRRGQKDEREYVSATVVEVACDKDLLLLTVNRGDFVAKCREVHRVVAIAPSFPSRLETVVMLSWPPLRHRTSVVGEVSCARRSIDHISSANPHGFKMKLGEVDITSEKGSSGAPLINGVGQYVAVLHGGHGTGFSYFISFEDVRATLTKWGVID